MIEIPPKFAGRSPVSLRHAAKARRERNSTWTRNGRVRPVWLKMCATTALGCERKRRSASATSTHPWRLPRRWQRTGLTSSRWSAKSSRSLHGFGRARLRVPIRRFLMWTCRWRPLSFFPARRERSVCAAGRPRRRLPFHSQNGKAASRRRIEARKRRHVAQTFAADCRMHPSVGITSSSEGKAGRIGQRLMAIVAEGPAGACLSYRQHQEMKRVAGKRETRLGNRLSSCPDNTRGTSSRQLRDDNSGATYSRHANWSRSTTLAIWLMRLASRSAQDVIAAGIADEDVRSLMQVASGATAYAEAVSVYLAIRRRSCADYCNSIVPLGYTSNQQMIRNLFGQASNSDDVGFR